MDRCRRSFSVLLLLILLVFVVSDLARAVDKVSPPPAPASLISSSVAAPPGSPVGMPSPMQASGNSPVPSPMPSSDGTLQPPPPPQSISSSPKQSPAAGPVVQPDPGSRSGDKGKKDGGKSTSFETMCGMGAVDCSASLAACLRRSSNDTKNMLLILHNVGENNITVVARREPGGVFIANWTVVKNSTEKKEFSNPVQAKNLTIVLHAGGSNCTVKMLSTTNIFQQFSTYFVHVNATFGVYAIFLTVLVVGGTWACCKFTGLSRRGDAGVPYQQLEMGIQTQSASVAEADATRGWDQWDGDWDEEVTVSRPSQKQHGGESGDALKNGDATTTSSKDGWEDWND